ncbi:hypothetical protein ACFFLM_03285 [Deinococcus oregonensis]|uniref:Uncharacterized protein n=1 Tax=Deinococcus oregonensis TaxID=1805970 RepID=A0ABV6AU26_9DEIO
MRTSSQRSKTAIEAVALASQPQRRHGGGGLTARTATTNGRPRLSGVTQLWTVIDIASGHPAHGDGLTAAPPQ